MTCCSHCRDTTHFFDSSTAEKELRHYRKSSPSNKTTRMLIDALGERTDLAGKSMIDIGGGIGAVPYELMDRGLGRSTLVEASEPYLEAARREAQRHGWTGRVDLRYGDFVELAPEVEDADIVTLDRVICCYPHMERLVEASAGSARRWYGVVYPKDKWFIGAGFSVVNLYCRLRGLNFRVYRHARVDATIQAQGFTPTYWESTLLWHVAWYERTGDPGASRQE